MVFMKASKLITQFSNNIIIDSGVASIIGGCRGNADGSLLNRSAHNQPFVSNSLLYFIELVKCLVVNDSNGNDSRKMFAGLDEV